MVVGEAGRRCGQLAEGAQSRGSRIIPAGIRRCERLATDAQVRELIEHRECFIFPSFPEGFALSVLEAVARRLPRALSYSGDEAAAADRVHRRGAMKGFVSRHTPWRGAEGSGRQAERTWWTARVRMGRRISSR